ncbi:hypothetical protein [Pseudomonas sp. MF6747]|uniref:hypothetical protein n=1 Tax=Pseudomonas sp. MF6747 TaxID=2797527 RepID=UPI00190DC159|nr:hypothetical protein [Pseudomonas sp. MF6747]MBK3509401.1 hypothetical protein [Pseudomonas sp. MF6747]
MKTGLLTALGFCLISTSFLASADTVKKLNPAEAIPELLGTYKIFLDNDFVKNGTITKYGISFGFPLDLYAHEEKGNIINLYTTKSGLEPKQEGNCKEPEIAKDGYCFRVIQMLKTGNGQYNLKEGRNEIKIEKI